jgi:hypothetical protein
VSALPAGPDQILLSNQRISNMLLLPNRPCLVALIVTARFQIIRVVLVTGTPLATCLLVLWIVKSPSGLTGVHATRIALTLFMTVRTAVVASIELALSRVILLMAVFRVLICMKCVVAMRTLVLSIVR